MQVHSADATAGMVVPMTSPEFSRSGPHCLTFEYEAKASSGTPYLEVHVRMTHYMLSGDKIYTSKSVRRKVSLTVQGISFSEETSYMLDFIGVVGDPRSTLIRVAEVGFSDKKCEKLEELSPIVPQDLYPGMTPWLASGVCSDKDWYPSKTHFNLKHIQILLVHNIHFCWLAMCNFTKCNVILMPRSL